MSEKFVLASNKDSAIENPSESMTHSQVVVDNFCYVTEIQEPVFGAPTQLPHIRLGMVRVGDHEDATSLDQEQA